MWNLEPYRLWDLLASLDKYVHVYIQYINYNTLVTLKYSVNVNYTNIIEQLCFVIHMEIITMS